MPSDWERQKEILLAALDMPECERSDFVRTATSGDEALRAEVLALLEEAVNPDSRFDGGAFGAQAEPTGRSESLGREDSGRLGPGDRIAKYTIRRLIGAGGMGEVFEAVQDQPRRSVALKVMRTEHADAPSLRRFELEAELLGLLRHRGIAQVYDAGVAESGVAGAGTAEFRVADSGYSARSGATGGGATEARRGSGHAVRRAFLAMELIEGETLLKHADTAGLDVRSRLDLLQRVCEAVEHAHERGVIHRDLKPGNILVDRFGQPKLIDFGIARLAGTEQARTLATRAGDILGTVQYMSPEQLAGDGGQVTTRSDVYALGMIAFRLLTGEYPYGRFENVLDAAEAMRTREPAPPRRIVPALAGDIDTIVLKAIERRAADRYASAGELGAEIGRVLRSEPIHARSASAWYRAKKFVRRNRGLVLGASLVAGSLILGMAGTTWQAIRANSALRSLERRIADLHEIIGAFNNFDSALFRVSGTIEERRAILKPMLPALMRLSEDASGGDTQLTLDIAAILLKIAHVDGGPFGANFGDRERARAAFEQVIATADRVLAEHPEHIGAMTLRYDTVRALSELLASVLNRPVDACNAMRRQCDLLTRQSELLPDDPFAWRLANASYGLLMHYAQSVGADEVRWVARDWGGCLARPMPRAATAYQRGVLHLARTNALTSMDMYAEVEWELREAAQAFAAARDEPVDPVDLQLSIADVDRYGGEAAKGLGENALAGARFAAAAGRYARLMEFREAWLAQRFALTMWVEAAESFLRAGEPERATEQARQAARELVIAFGSAKAEDWMAELLVRSLAAWLRAELTLGEMDGDAAGNRARAAEMLAVCAVAEDWLTLNPAGVPGTGGELESLKDLIERARGWAKPSSNRR